MGEDRAARQEERPAGLPTPPERLMLRRDRHLRFERGGIVYATDGRIGLLRQVVVDEVAGEVLELVIKLDRSDAPLSLPPEVVDKTAGSAVFLITSRESTPARAVPAPANASRLIKVDHKTLLDRVGRPRDRASRPRRAIAQAGRDYVETPPLPAPERVELQIGIVAPGAD
jgi:hypothetical protein